MGGRGSGNERLSRVRRVRPRFRKAFSRVVRGVGGIDRDVYDSVESGKSNVVVRERNGHGYSRLDVGELVKTAESVG
jgi:hypothetical protein